MRQCAKYLPLLWLFCASTAFAAAPTFVSYGIKQPGRGIQPCQVTPGAAIQLGDLLVLDYIAPPAFPGPVCSSNSPVENWACTPNPSSGIGADTQVWWKIAGAADVAASTLTFNATSSWNVCMLIDFRGVNQTTPVGTFVANTGSGTTMTVGATSSLLAGTTVLLLLNQDDANVAGFSIATITPPGAPWTSIVNFNGNVSPFSASLAALYQGNVTSTGSTTATMSISDNWTTIAIPILTVATPTQSVARFLPPIEAQSLASTYGNGVLGQETLVTDVSTACAQGTAPTFTGATGINCRAVSTGAGWQEIAGGLPTPPGTFTTNNPCSTNARAVGGCTFNTVTYGAGGTALPTLNPSNTTDVTCNNNSGDQALLASAAGSGGTSGSHKGLRIHGTQCDMTAKLVIPPFTDVQCANSSTIIFNPTANTDTASEYASFEVDGPNQGGSGHDVTISNCTFNGTNTQPPGYGGCHGTGCSPPPGGSYAILVEHASNVTVEDNLITNTQGQAGVEAYCGSTAPDCSNNSFIWNTFDGCALYGATSDNVTNSIISHNFYRDCRFGNELDGGSQAGTYFNDYNYVYTHYGNGYYYTYCGGRGTTDFYCTLHLPGTSCEATGNILDSGGNGAPFCNTFGSTASIFTVEGEGGTWSQNYCYNPTGGSGCSCDSIASGCTIGNPPNPAPSGP